MKKVYNSKTDPPARKDLFGSINRSVLLLFVLCCLGLVRSFSQDRSIEFKSFKNIPHEQLVETGYDVNTWDAAVVSFDLGTGDIYEGGTEGKLLYVRMIDQDGEWHIKADMRTHSSSPKYTAWVMFISKGFSKESGLVVKSDGKVGIGTSNPFEKLHVEGDIFMGFNRTFKTSGPMGFKADHDDSGDGSFKFNTGNDLNMILTDAGDLGIGTSTPSEKLDVRGNLSINGRDGATSNTGANLLLYGARNNDGMTFGQISFFNYDKSGTNQDISLAGISAEKQGADGSKLVFSTAMDGDKNGKMFIANDGRIGVGVSSPAEKLHVAGNGIFSGDLSIGKLSATNINVSGNGNFTGDLSVGSSSSNKNLRLYGTAEVKELHMDPTATWSDFVFEEGYDLPTLEEVNTFIQKNKHLPGIPSAKQVSEEGYNQSEVNALLLQKIEELTLYLIELKQENQRLAETHRCTQSVDN